MLSLKLGLDTWQDFSSSIAIHKIHLHQQLQKCNKSESLMCNVSISANAPADLLVRVSCENSTVILSALISSL